MGGIREELSKAEEQILKALLPNRKLWYRAFLKIGVSDKPLRRGLRRLHREGYISMDTPTDWKRGMKISCRLRPKGKRVAVELLLGDVGRRLFIRVLEKLKPKAESSGIEDEQVLELALEIVNLLGKEEKLARARDALSDAIRELM